MNSKLNRIFIGAMIGLGVGLALSIGTGNFGVGIGVGVGLAIIFGGGAYLRQAKQNS